MTTLRLPGLVDVHVHMREPGGEHKETWDTGTAAAIAGGITTVLAMPNTNPAVVDESSLLRAVDAAATGARCDYGHFVGASLDNADHVAGLAPAAVGIKMYLGQTFGDLRLDDQSVWADHLESWPHDSVVAIHAEADVLATVIGMAAVVGRPIHICHVASASDIQLIADAKERGQAITCEVTPHHLFLDETSGLARGRCEVRPRLGSPADRQELWNRLDVIDCFATDHAPHTLAEKDGVDPPPGFPGVETMVPLLLTAVHDGLMTIDDLVDRLHRRPIEIYGLPSEPDSWVEIDVDAEYPIPCVGQSRSGWTPFEGMSVRGRVDKVVIGGVTAFEHGRVIAAAGTGRNLRRDD
jgi:dihydroorotase-like cyclic amidohydrolase